VEPFGNRFDKVDDKRDGEVIGVKSKVDGINHRLDTEALSPRMPTNWKKKSSAPVAQSIPSTSRCRQASASHAIA